MPLDIEKLRRLGIEIIDAGDGETVSIQFVSREAADAIRSSLKTDETAADSDKPGAREE